MHCCCLLCGAAAASTHSGARTMQRSSATARPLKSPNCRLTTPIKRQTTPTINPRIERRGGKQLNRAQLNLLIELRPIRDLRKSDQLSGTRAREFGDSGRNRCNRSMEASDRSSDNCEQKGPDGENSACQLWERYRAFARHTTDVHSRVGIWKQFFETVGSCQ